MHALRKGCSSCSTSGTRRVPKKLPNSLLGKRIVVKSFICLFSLDVALNIYKGHLIGWSSQLFLSILLYCVIFKQIQNFKKPILSEHPIEKSSKEVKSIPITHKYMTAHFPWLIQLLCLKVARLN
jgi:putative exporter of polyketide antibiotics